LSTSERLQLRTVEVKDEERRRKRRRRGRRRRGSSGKADAP
jgi:hypothetical protein